MHFRLGVAYYDSGRFAEAAREFELAYEQSRRPPLLHNMFVAYRDAGDLPNAIRSLREFLRLNPDAEGREQLTARLAVMERQAADQGVDTSATQAQAAAPAEAAAAASSTEPARPPASGGGMWEPGWIIFGVGIAAVIGGAITGALALGEQSALDAMCDASHACDPGFESTRDSAVLLAGLTDGLVIGGGVIAVLGIVLALAVPTGGGESRPSASLMCTSTGCMAAGQVRF
jgi:hypothetical protein